MSGRVAASGWEGYRSLGAGGRTVHFKVALTESGAREMSHRQLQDFYLGLALVAASFQPDERFLDDSSAEARAQSVRLDEELDALLGELS